MNNLRFKYLFFVTILVVFSVSSFIMFNAEITQLGKILIFSSLVVYALLCANTVKRALSIPTEGRNQRIANIIFDTFHLHARKISTEDLEEIETSNLNIEVLDIPKRNGKIDSFEIHL